MHLDAAAKFASLPAVHITAGGATFEGVPVQHLSPPGPGFASLLLGAMQQEVTACVPGATVDITQVVRVGAGPRCRPWVVDLDLRGCERLSTPDVALAVRSCLVTERVLRLRHGLKAGAEALLVNLPQREGLEVDQANLTAAGEGSGLNVLEVLHGTSRYEWPGFAQAYALMVDVAPTSAPRRAQGKHLWEQMQMVGNVDFRIVLQGLQLFSGPTTQTTALWDVLSPLVRGNLTAAHLQQRSNTMLDNATLVAGGCLLLMAGVGAVLTQWSLPPGVWGAGTLVTGIVPVAAYMRAVRRTSAYAAQLNPLPGLLDIMIGTQATADSGVLPLLNIHGIPRVGTIREQPLVTYQPDHPIWVDGAFRTFNGLWKNAARRWEFRLQPVAA